MRAVVVMLAVSLYAVSANAEGTKPRLVIAPLTAAPDLEGTRDAIASEVCSSVEQTAAFRMVKPNVVRTMVAVSPSASCPQKRCALRLARLVEADMVLTGEISEHDSVVTVAVRIYAVRDGEITHRLAFDVSTKREDLARDVDNGVRSMLGLGIRVKPQSATNERFEIAKAPHAKALHTKASRAKSVIVTHVSHTYDFNDATNQEVWRARFNALN